MHPGGQQPGGLTGLHPHRYQQSTLTRGVRVRASIDRVTGDTAMEGLSRQLSLVSTDLISRTRQVHRRGPLLDGILASLRLPVLFPPIPTTRVEAS